MMTIITLVSILILPAMAQEQSIEDKLIGKWQSIKFGGLGDSSDHPRNLISIAFSDQHRAEIISPSEGKATVKYRLDVSKTPFQIELDGEKKAYSFTGIFKFKGEMLVLFLRRIDLRYEDIDAFDERPVEFGNGSRQDELLVVLKRSKNQ